MSEGQSGEIKHIKVGIFGGQRVGKTYLAHKLVDKEYTDYVPTVECQRFQKNDEESREIITYYDFPPVQEKLIENIPHEKKYDIMIGIFKDSTSFGQLYELLEAITIKSDEGNPDFNQYWENIKFVILIYTDFEQKGKVQIEQLFSILSEEIRNFNRTAIIKQFILRTHLSNCEDLRNLIQNKSGHVSEDMAASQKQGAIDEEQLERRIREAKSKRLSYSKEHAMTKSRDFSKSFNVENQIPSKEEARNSIVQYVQITEVKQANIKEELGEQIDEREKDYDHAQTGEAAQHVEIHIQPPQQEQKTQEQHHEEEKQTKIQHEDESKKMAQPIQSELQPNQQLLREQDENQTQKQKPINSIPKNAPINEINQSEVQIKPQEQRNLYPHGAPLPQPQSNYLGGGKTKKEKKSSNESQTCACIIM